MDTLLVFDLAKFVPLVAVLTLAAIQDYKTGEVQNRLWLYAPIGLTLSIIEMILCPGLAVAMGIAAAVTAAISLTLFYVGAWGGADTKAVLTIAASTPLTPLATIYPTVTVITTLTIASLLAVPVIVIKRKKSIRYMPYLLIGVLGSLFI
jgi:Flp pilus assembly protein protease CpaA